MKFFTNKWNNGIIPHACVRRVGLAVLAIFLIQIVCYFLVYHKTLQSIDQFEEKRFMQFEEKHLMRFEEKQFIRFLAIRNETTERNKSTPMILVWAPTWGEVNNLNRCREICPYKCEMTLDKSQIKKADLVKFSLTHLWKINWEIESNVTIDLPTYRRPDQVWTVFNSEPPCHLFGDLKVFNGLFNWTVWYRKDATFFKPYKTYTKLTADERKEAENELKKRNFYKEKTNEIVGMISNCNEPELRYLFINRLSKYLKLDMFGKCFNRVCGTASEYTTCTNITKTYKFYLALENSRCKDYITEKYWESLTRGQVPIVNWDYSHIDKSIPVPGSFISISDFKNTKELADYITKVSNDEKLYNSYFEWRKEYKLKVPMCPSCVLCEELYKQRIRPQTYEDFAGWVQGDVCEQVNKKNFQARLWRKGLYSKMRI